MERVRGADYFTGEGAGVRCQLCPHSCLLLPGQTGLCRVRECRQGGELVTRTYGNVSSVALDPIEKKPLYHFYPGSTILSLGTFGCNLRCKYCQNWQISQRCEEAQLLPPRSVAELAQKYQTEGCIGVAFTYNEPTVWYEFIWDAAYHIKAAGLACVLVTNGYMSPKPWRELLSRIDAVNVDVKGWSEEFYRRVCGGRLKPVLENVETAGELCHVELTYLLIPGHNDDDDSIRGFARWVRERLGRNTPVHFSRCFPNYRLDVEPTPISTLEKARRLAEEWLDFVYLGNVTIPGAADTRCAKCRFVLIQRSLPYAPRIIADNNRCPACGEEVPWVCR
ncbi:MAG: AmmeMemoRadiSam system radical SAM enzyme [Firmicutes bacterium]|nr:AmmeMemoRadiSam system radical SAM enzyme [Bacillota bacterium]